MPSDNTYTRVVSHDFKIERRRPGHNGIAVVDEDNMIQAFFPTVSDARAAIDRGEFDYLFVEV